MSKKQAIELLRLVNRKLFFWSKGESDTFKGVKNLTIADVQSIKRYTEQKIIKGNIYGMEEPTGGVGEVLKKVGMLK